MTLMTRKTAFLVSFFLIMITAVNIHAQTPRELPLDLWISGNLMADGEDWYSVRINQDGFLTVETSGDKDTNLEAYTAFEDLIGEDDDSGEDYNARLEIFAKAGQTYLFKMTFWDSDESGVYKIRAVLDPIAPDTEFNTERSRAVQILPADTVKVYIRNAGESRWYAVNNVQAGIRLAIFTTGNMDTMLTLYNAKGKLLEEDDDSGSDCNARIVFEAEAGSYFIEVRAWEEETGRTILHLETRDNKPDQYENDNDIANAKEIRTGEIQNRSFTNADDIDWVYFTVTQSGLYSISACAEDEYLDTYLELYDSRQDLLADDDDSGSNYDSLIRIHLNPGTYYIKVSCLDEDPLDDNRYNLEVRRER